jgi:hypothetical protein
MGILDIFKKKKKSADLGSPSLFFHEDDYCQVELSPIENLPLFQSESNNINTLQADADENGFTEIYVRNAPGIKLSDRQIQTEQLDEILSSLGVNRISTVVTGYGQTHREICNNTIGFGQDYSAIYYDFKEGIVQHIWMTGVSNFERAKLEDCLFQIGQKWKLLLMDWNETEPVNLGDRTFIRAYLA